MGEKFTREQRSACMRSVGPKDTAPEMRVRKLVHSLGYRYALHVSRLRGKPDLVFTSRRKIIFVHGCFWHSHSCSHGRRAPVQNSDYWSDKRKGNSVRDRAHVQALRREGWDVLVIWECWTRDLASLQRRLEKFLKSPSM